MAEDDEKRMTFTEHLGELRTRIIRSIVVLVLAIFLCYLFSNTIFEQLARPLAPLSVRGIVTAEPAPDAAAPAPAQAPGAEPRKAPARQLEWTVLNPLEFVLVQFKIAGYGGFLLALPYILWQLMAFVFPGLHPHERRMVQILIAGCSALAVVGVAVAYFGVFPLVLPYLLEWTPAWVQVQLRITETLNIIIKGLVGFALAFQFPMAVLILVYLGLLTPQTLREYRKIAIVGMAFLSAVLTPPDPFSMMVMLTPLVLLYEASILLSYVVIRRKRQDAENAEKA